MSEQLLGLPFRQYKNLKTKEETFSTKITIKLRNFQYYALSLVSYKKIRVMTTTKFVNFSNPSQIAAPYERHK